MINLLQIDNLTRRFTADSPPAVDDLSLAVRSGEVFTLVGPSGCGKTTALRMIAGFERPDAGVIRLRDEVIESRDVHVPPERRRIGLVFQEMALFPHLDVLHNVMYGLHELPGRQRRQRAMQVLDWVGMADYAARRPHELSGGQQQRIALARSIGPAPSIILLDEPFNSLDAALRADVRKQVRTVLKDHDMTALLVTHDQEEALSFADRVGVMNRGRLLQVGTPQQVYHQPATSTVACFLGHTNLITGHAHGWRADTPLGPLCLNHEIKGDVLLSVRPEHLRLAPVQQGQPVGRVVSRQFKGHDLTFEVSVGDRLYTVHSDYTCPFEVGQEVCILHAEPAIILTDDDRLAAVPGDGKLPA